MKLLKRDRCSRCGRGEIDPVTQMLIVLVVLSMIGIGLIALLGSTVAGKDALKVLWDKTHIVINL